MITGAILIIGPLLWCLGLLLRYLPGQMGLPPAGRAEALETQPFAAPRELAMYAADPELVANGYAVFLLGAVALFGTYAVLGRIAAVASPRLAGWGAALLIASLLGRFFHAGAETAVFAMVDMYGPETATDFAMESYQTLAYGPWRIPVWCAAGQYLGIVLLALAAYRSRVLGAARCAVLIWGGWLWVGVLKESHLLDVTAAAAVCAVLAPIGIRLIRHHRSQTDPETALADLTGIRWW
ncbi:hypothetical protein [Glycomyces albidus]|uniref:DUF4386 family protein n=1 Tax=Glycomyces albidus TaxID=2656774 RepID=A0A6L5GDZ2_9ACTN|nr:hypothetical protein [Glycomyces albidus]MQM27924.1 hypothetical protein [Glycomyces albidus]